MLMCLSQKTETYPLTGDFSSCKPIMACQGPPVEILTSEKSQITFYLFLCYSHQSNSDYSWEVYIVHSCVFSGDESTCMRIDPV